MSAYIHKNYLCHRVMTVHVSVPGWKGSAPKGRYWAGVRFKHHVDVTFRTQTLPIKEERALLYAPQSETLQFYGGGRTIPTNQMRHNVTVRQD